MPNAIHHIPFAKTIAAFFTLYGLGHPKYPEVMCMRLEDQPDKKLTDMPLYRANFFRVILFTKAKLKFKQADHSHTVINNCICFTYPGKLESWKRTGRLYGFVLYFTADFAALDTAHKNFDKDYPYFNFNSEQVLPLTVDETTVLSALCMNLIEEINSGLPDNLEMIRKLLPVYLHAIKRIYQKNIKAVPVELKQSKTMYNRFRKEIENHFQQLSESKTDHKITVATIARKLHVNPNYLNSIIKHLTGKPASAHIQEKMLLEAKSYLMHTDLQVAEIAYRLGYSNVSYFNRFFKTHTGSPPLDFRR